MLKKYGIVLLFGILILASVLRLWQLGQVPISPDWDEAAYGYNAYAVIQTGKDEFGEFLPVVLRSFDDYKPALYLYLVIPFVWVMGVTTEAVRLPSALAGIITVYVTYELIKLLFKRHDIALLTAFLLAISPWHIQFSRIAFEANVGVLLNMSMVYFFLRGLKNPKLLFLSPTFAALSIYVYQSEKVFTPLLALTLVIIYYKELKKISLQYLVSAFIVGCIVIFPMLSYLLTNEQALTRARETSIFADKANLTRTDTRLDVDAKHNNVLGLLLDNRRVFYLTKIVDGYLAHYSLNWLFITGDNNARHHAPSMGLLYIVELPFLLIGIYTLIFYRIDRRVKWLVFLWFLLAPVPASITSGVPHAVRTINFLPLFQLFTALGLLAVWESATQRKHAFIPASYIRSVFLIVLFSAFSLNVFYYLNQYFVQMNYFTSRDWQYGYEEMVPYIHSVSDDYDSIIVTNKEPLDQSYIFFLFYLKYSPSDYHREAEKNSSGGFAETHAFGKYEFRPFDWANEPKDVRTLYVGRPADFPDGINALKTKHYVNGEEAIVVVEGSQ